LDIALLKSKVDRPLTFSFAPETPPKD